MSQGAHVHMTTKVAFDDDGTGAGHEGATVRLSVEGVVAISAQDYEWPDVATAEQAQDVAFLARWAFGRAIGAEVRRPPISVSGEASSGGWKTVVTWLPPRFPTITVTLDGFASLDDARIRAQGAVKDLIQALVPPNAPDERRNRLNMIYLPNPPADWAEGLYRMAAQYP